MDSLKKIAARMSNAELVTNYFTEVGTRYHLRDEFIDRVNRGTLVPSLLNTVVNTVAPPPEEVEPTLRDEFVEMANSGWDFEGFRKPADEIAGFIKNEALYDKTFEELTDLQQNLVKSIRSKYRMWLRANQ